MALVPTSKLDAINQCLINIGESPVVALTGLLVDAQIAADVVDEVCREVQASGWFFNTETHTFSPDVTGALIVPANTLSARSGGANSGWDLVLRGTQMYDKVANSLKFTVAQVTLTIVVYLDFTMLPEPARRLISLRAARMFQERQLGVDAISAENTRDEARAWAAMLHEESDNGDYNIASSDSVYNVMSRGF